MIAKPIADSAAATAKIKKTNTWPVISELKCEKTIKLVWKRIKIKSENKYSRVPNTRIGLNKRIGE